MRFHALGLAIALPLSTTSAQASEGHEWLTQCQDSKGNTSVGDAQCLADYQDHLRAEQTTLLAKIGARLTAEPTAGANYRMAARSLKQSQKYWLAYIQADCAAISESFGRGNAQGQAGGSCLAGHYETRNDVLRDFEKSLDDETATDD